MPRRERRFIAGPRPAALSSSSVCTFANAKRWILLVFSMITFVIVWAAILSIVKSYETGLVVARSESGPFAFLEGDAGAQARKFGAEYVDEFSSRDMVNGYISKEAAASHFMHRYHRFDTTDFLKWRASMRNGTYFCVPPSKWLRVRIGKRDCSPLLRNMRGVLERFGYRYHANSSAQNSTFGLLYGSDEKSCSVDYPMVRPGYQIRQCLGNYFFPRFNEKDGLYRALMLFNRTLPPTTDFSIRDMVPRTWIIRSEKIMKRFKEDVQKIYSQYTTDALSRRPWFIFKPAHADRGEGIVIVEDALQYVERLQSRGSRFLKKRAYIVQEYKKHVMLIDGYKFSIRVWAYIASVKPLVVLYSDGLLYRAYKPFNESMYSRASHLSNTFPEDKNYWKRYRAHTMHMDDGGYFGFFGDLAERFGDHDFDWMNTVLKPALKKMARFVLRSIVRRVGTDEDPRGVNQIIAIDASLDAGSTLNVTMWNETTTLYPDEMTAEELEAYGYAPTGAKPAEDVGDTPNSESESMTTENELEYLSVQELEEEREMGELDETGRRIIKHTTTHYTAPPKKLRVWVHEVNRAAAYNPGDAGLSHPEKTEMLKKLEVDTVLIAEEILYRQDRGLPVSSGHLNYLGGWEALLDDPNILDGGAPSVLDAEDDEIDTDSVVFEK